MFLSYLKALQAVLSGKNSPFWTSFLAGMDPRGRHNCGPHQFHGKTPIQIVQKFKEKFVASILHLSTPLSCCDFQDPATFPWWGTESIVFACFLVTDDHMIYDSSKDLSLFSCLDSCLTLPCLTGKVQSAGAPAATPLWGCRKFGKSTGTNDAVLKSITYYPSVSTSFN